MLHPDEGDQTHHFAAFFELGFFAGATIAQGAAYWLDFSPFNTGLMNTGDVALGVYAAQLGADLKSGKIKQADIASRIRQDLCKH